MRNSSRKKKIPMNFRWWFTGIRAKLEDMSASERRTIHTIIKAEDTTENTFLPKMGITVGEYCAVFLASK